MLLMIWRRRAAVMKTNNLAAPARQKTPAGDIFYCPKKVTHCFKKCAIIIIEAIAPKPKLCYNEID